MWNPDDIDMDLVSSALIVAASAGVASGATAIGKNVLVDASTALRDASKREK